MKGTLEFDGKVYEDVQISCSDRGVRLRFFRVFGKALEDMEEILFMDLSAICFEDTALKFSGFSREPWSPEEPKEGDKCVFLKVRFHPAGFGIVPGKAADTGTRELPGMG